MSREVTVLSHGLIATSPFSIEKFAGNDWRILLDEQDKRSTVLESVDFSRAGFVTCLRNDETRIKGDEKILRLKNKTGIIRYGATVFMGLWIDYEVKQKKSVLENLYLCKRITNIDFPGDVFVHPEAGRCVLGVLRGSTDGTWRSLFRRLSRFCNIKNLSAVSSL